MTSCLGGDCILQLCYEDISYLILSGYIQLGYNTLNEISKQMDEIREKALNIKKIIEDECL